MKPVVAMLTDFGLADPYVGIMKGVVAGIAPDARILDLCHGVPAQDVRIGALFLDAAWRWYPEGTVFLCVVDPGVGTARRALASRAAGRLFVGPDNGLLSLLPAPEHRLVEVRGEPASRTFHGRDVFAPLAARLAAGVLRFDDVGPAVPDPVVLHLPEPGADGVGEVLYIDGYGNAVTNLPAASGGRVEHACGILQVRGAYGEAAPGEALALTGSTSRLEIAVRDGDAARQLGIRRGDPVRLLPG